MLVTNSDEVVRFEFCVNTMNRIAEDEAFLARNAFIDFFFVARSAEITSCVCESASPHAKVEHVNDKPKNRSLFSLSYNKGTDPSSLGNKTEQINLLRFSEAVARAPAI